MIEVQNGGNSLGELLMSPVQDAGITALTGEGYGLGVPVNVEGDGLATPAAKRPGRPKKVKADESSSDSWAEVAEHFKEDNTNNTQVESVLGVFKINADTVTPKLATSGSGAFDLHANFSGVKEVTAYTASNKKSTTAVRDNFGVLSVILQPRTRAMIPTGLIFDIPEGFKLEFSARSGLSLKEGLNLANGQALIDFDYVEESFILIQNNSDLRVEIQHGDRVAQAALARVIPTTIAVLNERPAQKTARAGGMGSTGVK